MSKKIDLTQFDAITKGPWNITVSAFKGKYILEEATNPTCVDEVCANADLMQAGPELIAELKRMYERETELLTALQVIKEYTNESQSMDNIKEYVNNVCDTNLPYWGCACQGPHTGPC